MRRDLFQYLKRCFEGRLKDRLPQFELAKDDKCPSGCRLFRWRMKPDLTAFLLLETAPQFNRFTVSVAWSARERFPQDVLHFFPVDVPERSVVRDSPTNGSLNFRLAMLWPPHRDQWWKACSWRGIDDLSVEEMAHPELLGPEPPMSDVDRRVIESNVNEVVERIVEYAIPYLRQVADETSSPMNPIK